jgi:hypothetical protein
MYRAPSRAGTAICFIRAAAFLTKSGIDLLALGRGRGRNVVRHVAAQFLNET